jgi:phage tail sheath protein FI
MALTYLTPDVYVEEIAGGPRPIEAVGTQTLGVVGQAPDPSARVNEPIACNNWSSFVRIFAQNGARSTPLSHAVFGYFLNGGPRCYVVNTPETDPISGGGKKRQGLRVLEAIDEVAIVAAPGQTSPEVYEALLSFCELRRDCVAILDGPDFADINELTRVATATSAKKKPSSTSDAAPPAEEEGSPRGLRARQSDYGSFYFPHLTVADPLPPNELVDVAPSGHIAGIWARNDALRGVHKAPANEPVRGAVNLTYRVTREEQAELNPAGVNVIRFFPNEGIKVWGARTLADSASEWRYLNVRRLFNMIEESIEESTRWIVFEPNDRTLWRSIRRDIGAFLTRLWRDGALMGATPQEAFFVQCDEETNPSDVIDAGMVVTRIGIAPVKPAEFILFRISQHMAGANLEMEGAV